MHGVASGPEVHVHDLPTKNLVQKVRMCAVQQRTAAVHGTYSLWVCATSTVSSKYMNAVQPLPSCAPGMDVACASLLLCDV
jgi:hypothetical protein